MISIKIDFLNFIKNRKGMNNTTNPLTSGRMYVLTTSIPAQLDNIKLTRSVFTSSNSYLTSAITDKILNQYFPRMGTKY